MSEHKALRGVEIKDAEQGEIKAVFATLGVIDKDNDVTVKGAFDDGAPVRISAYGHASWGQALPVGKGVIRVIDDEAILEGKFFMETQHGRDTFKTVKEMGDLQEFSYGFDVVKSEPGTFEEKDVRFLQKMKVHEVSPVMLGAGVGTRTLAVKNHTTFSDQADTVLGDVLELVNRAKAFGSQSTEQERKEGRTLSLANRDRLAALLQALGEAGTSLTELLDHTDPNKSRKLLEREFMRFERAKANI